MALDGAAVISALIVLIRSRLVSTPHSILDPIPSISLAENRISPVPILSKDFWLNIMSFWKKNSFSPALVDTAPISVASMAANLAPWIST